MFPLAYGSAGAGTFRCTSLSLPFSLQQDALPHRSVLQRKVTDSFAEVFSSCVFHHSFRVAQEQEEGVEPRNPIWKVLKCTYIVLTNFMHCIPNRI